MSTSKRYPSISLRWTGVKTSGCDEQPQPIVAREGRSVKSQGLPSDYDSQFAMERSTIEIDGPYRTKKWWIFPWRTVSHSQRVSIFCKSTKDLVIVYIGWYVDINISKSQIHKSTNPNMKNGNNQFSDFSVYMSSPQWKITKYFQPQNRRFLCSEMKVFFITWPKLQRTSENHPRARFDDFNRTFLELGNTICLQLWPEIPTIHGEITCYLYGILHFCLMRWLSTYNLITGISGQNCTTCFLLLFNGFFEWSLLGYVFRIP